MNLWPTIAWADFEKFSNHQPNTPMLLSYPPFARLGPGGSALRHLGDGVYYRPAGEWKVNTIWTEHDKLEAVGKGPMAHTTGTPIIPCTEREYLLDNAGYVMEPELNEADAEPGPLCEPIEPELFPPGEVATTKYVNSPWVPLRVEVRPLLTDGMMATDRTGEAVIMLSDSLTLAQARITAWHEIVHLLRAAGRPPGTIINLPEEEATAEAAAIVLAANVPEILNWLGIEQHFTKNTP